MWASVSAVVFWLWLCFNFCLWCCSEKLSPSLFLSGSFIHYWCMSSSSWSTVTMLFSLYTFTAPHMTKMNWKNQQHPATTHSSSYSHFDFRCFSVSLNFLPFCLLLQRFIWLARAIPMVYTDFHIRTLCICVVRSIEKWLLNISLNKYTHIILVELTRKKQRLTCARTHKIVQAKHLFFSMIDLHTIPNSGENWKRNERKPSNNTTNWKKRKYYWWWYSHCCCCCRCRFVPFVFFAYTNKAK